jgi:hypothetical protein
MGNDIIKDAANAPAPIGAVTGRLVIASFAAKAGGSEPWIEESASVVKVEGGRPWQGRIGILAKAPPGGVTVHLSSSDPKNVPVADQHIPPGVDMWEFTFPPTSVGGFAQVATVSASLNGTSSSVKIQVLTPR